MRISAPAGSSLRFAAKGEVQELALPGELALRLAPFAPCPVKGRLVLNELAEALEIPSSAQVHLHEDREAVWVEVAGSLLLRFQSGVAEVDLGRASLRRLLSQRSLELGDGLRFRLRLSLVSSAR